ncbi:hypothetical protein SAMN03097699_1361 [Flavobacteriaceae bacterium MAR_2010_188]|nr:hypothetical protein SAMN03097699_1361 [Flavobacteriaceae bacterium MAR_2010_188]
MKSKLFVVLVTCTLIFSCKSDKKEDAYNADMTAEETDSNAEKNYYKDGELEVITEAMEFYTADTINSGWNRIVYKNESPEVHFIMMDLYPSDTITMDHVKNELLPPFDEGMAQIMKGDIDSAMVAFGGLPSWFGKIRFLGGTGLISPGEVATSTIKLEPGKYLMECYVKMANGEWHTSHGMAKFIHVKEDATSLTPPMENHTISVSSTKGIQMEGEPSNGNKIFKVDFVDQKPYEHFMGHDVNILRYDNSANLDSLVAWMNWMKPTGLATPSPNGITFLGGVNNCEAGSSGYFSVDLEPGNYVLISEVPAADKKGLMKKFTVQ